MPKQRDPFANVERMRRELGELFDDVWTRAGLSPRQRVGFRPRVDVYYSGDRTRAVVKADLSGVRIDDVNLEIRGRSLLISGERRPSDTEGRVYQQIEIEHGPFEREVQLGADVEAENARATYEDGILRVELPIVVPGAKARKVPIADASNEDGGEAA
jgi:HSP20 family protein